ncbi:PAS domain-containing sensor histidine kinase [Aestuariivirga sp.]|uniref:PAS domain-containing sensor histidine kinase n=1 Tax=Aestuariivirga sp. TaxID=2650926 RepID=UPI003BACB7C0
MAAERAPWPNGGGRMGELIRQHDWASTALGPVELWQDGLRTAAGIMLGTRHPASITWGEEQIFLYNDGCASLLGPEKHPAILGCPAAQAWPESHHLVEAEMRGIMEGGGSIWHENRLIPIRRYGAVEDAWWTYSRSPIHDARARSGVGGVLTLLTETTKPMLAKRDSDARFRALFEQSPLMVHVFDTSGQTIAVNPALERNFGVSAEAMRQYNIFHDPHFKVEPARSLVNRAFAGKVLHTPPLRHNASFTVDGGRSLWVEATTYPVKDEAGQIREVVMLAQDVTARVEAQTALSDSEARFRIAREAAQLGIFDYDFSTGICLWDQRIRELWGASADEAISDTVFMNAIHPDDREAVTQALARAVDPAGTGDYRAEYRVIHRQTGVTRWLMAAGRAFFVRGRPSRLVGTVQDISDRRRYEDALRESEERLQIGLSAAQLGHWSWDAGTDSISFSKQACAIFGIPTGQEITWQSLQSLLHPDDVQRAVRAVKASLASGADYRIEYRILRPDGARLWVSALGRPIYGAGGMPPGMIGVIQDITERKRAEEQIRLLMAEVNHRSKNLLAVVQSIAHQTSARGSPRAFAHRFSERLQGLAASHDLLVGNAWQGVDLSDLVQSQLAHFRDLVRHRIHFKGPSLQLRPAAAQALGMALHELTTNAGKYGSLSSTEGQVAIHWATGEAGGQQRFTMEWRELGGPPVVSPIASGFGSKLISHMTEIALQGSARLDYPPDGVVWTLDAPLDSVTPRADEDAVWPVSQSY